MFIWRLTFRRLFIYLFFYLWVTHQLLDSEELSGLSQSDNFLSGETSVPNCSKCDAIEGEWIQPLPVPIPSKCMGITSNGLHHSKTPEYLIRPQISKNLKTKSLCIDMVCPKIAVHSKTCLSHYVIKWKFAARILDKLCWMILYNRQSH